MRSGSKRCASARLGQLARGDHAAEHRAGKPPPLPVAGARDGRVAHRRDGALHRGRPADRSGKAMLAHPPLQVGSGGHHQFVPGVEKRPPERHERPEGALHRRCTAQHAYTRLPSPNVASLYSATL